MSVVLGSDLFGRADTANGLGVADTGQVWQPLIATMQVVGGRARATGAARSAAVIDVVAGGGDATVDADCGAGNAVGGYALYARCTDADNWWRVGVNAATAQVEAGSHQEPYSYVDHYSCTYYTYSDTTGNYTSSGAPYSSATQDTALLSYWPSGHLESAILCDVVYATGYTTVIDYVTAYTWKLTLEKCVAGVVTLAAEVALGAAPAHLTVVAAGSNITGTCTGGQVAATDSFNRTATRHGLGYSETTSFGNTDGLDNLTITVPVPPFVGWGVPV